MLYNSKTKAMPAGLSPSMNVHRVRRLLDVERLNYCTRCYCVQLLDMLKFYTGFEISDQTGNALTQKEMTTLHYDRITSLQVTHLTHTHTHTHSSGCQGSHTHSGDLERSRKNDATLWHEHIYQQLFCGHLFDNHKCISTVIQAFLHVFIFS